MTVQEEIEALLGHVASGDPAAFRRLYGETAPRLYGIALRILRDEALAQEVIEEVFVTVWEGAGQYRTMLASPLTWLVTITRDAAIARLSAARASGRAAGPVDITDRLYAPRPSPGEYMAKMREEARVLDRCLKELPPGRADMLRQAYLYGATYSVLAESAGVTRGSLRTALRADLVHLRDCLSR
jgi:RNA polymerase sigma factor (sigma-70 family)